MKIDYTFNGFMLYGILMTLSALMAGLILTVFLMQIHHLSLYRHKYKIKKPDIMEWFSGIAAMILGLLMLCQMIWGTWLSTFSYWMPDYRSFGEWLFFMSIRFSGFIAILGMGLYPLARNKKATP